MSVDDLDRFNPLPLMRLDAQDKLLCANRAASEAFGVPDAGGGPIRDYLPPFAEVDLAACRKETAPLEFCAPVSDRLFQFWCVPAPGGPYVQIYAVDITRHTDADNRLLLADLRHRMKELSCFYGLAESLRTRESITDVYADVARLVPSAWQYPELARARVIMDGEEYVAAPFTDTPWGQSAAVVAHGRARGMVQVFYLEERRAAPDMDVFLPAERHLLDALARTLGEALERHEAEAENRAQTLRLAQEHNRLETILRSIGEGVVVTDHENRVLLMNPAALHLLGIDDSEPLGQDFLALLGDETFIAMWRKTAERARDFSKQELTIARPVERSLWVTRSRIPDLRLGEAGHVSILHDVTQQREIDRMKSDFVSSVSHELRTPMTSIKGFARTLLNKPELESEQRGKFISIMDREADRMIALIEELLVISRIESGQIVADRAAVDISALVERIFHELEQEALRKDIFLRLAKSAPVPQPVGDAEKLHIALFNLVENAVKFTPAGGQVTVRLRPEKTALTIRIEDTGVGIPPEEHRRIFERFYRVARPGVQESGTGLGLYIAKEMIKLHAGQIEVDSTLGRGTAFVVRLPLTDSPPGEPAAQIRATEETIDG